MQQTGCFTAFDESGEQHKVLVLRRVIHNRDNRRGSSVSLHRLAEFSLSNGTVVAARSEESVNGKCEFFVGQLRLTAAKEDVDNATKM